MKKPISLLMAVLFLALPVKFDPTSNEYAIAEALSKGDGEPTIVGEAEWLRETNSETYMLSDGGYECVVFSEDKYFRDDEGSLSLIDNSIIASPAEINGKEYMFKNRANGYTVRFADTQPGVYISAKGHEIGYSLIGSAPTACTVGGHKDLKAIAGYELSGANYVVYNNVSPQTDIVYASAVDSVKEYIVLNGSSAPHEFAFAFDLYGGSIGVTEEGIYTVYDAEGEPVFELGILFAVDSAGEFTDALTYGITTERDTVTVTVTLDADYLSDPDRVFPLVVDPSISIYGASNTKDSFVSSRHPTLNYYMNTELMTGRDVGYYVRRTYIGFTLPSNVIGKSISSAYINIKKSGGSTPYVKAYRVTGSWTSSTITWNNKPGVTSTYASGYAALYSNNWYRLYVTDIVQCWTYQTYSNNGFMLKDDTETGDYQWTNFYSSDAASPNKPELHITYYYYGPRGYLNTSSNAYNCLSYALGYTGGAIDAGELGLSLSSLNGKNYAELLTITSGLIEEWMDDHPVIYYDVIDNYDSDITIGKFRIVLRVGFRDIDGDGCYDFGDSNDEEFDFHLMYQTSTGNWADKFPGSVNSQLHANTAGVDPATFSFWVNNNTGATYTSNCKYYAIRNFDLN